MQYKVNLQTAKSSLSNNPRKYNGFLFSSYRVIAYIFLMGCFGDWKSIENSVYWLQM